MSRSQALAIVMVTKASWARRKHMEHPKCKFVRSDRMAYMCLVTTHFQTLLCPGFYDMCTTILLFVRLPHEFQIHHETPVQIKLKWKFDRSTADRISNFNRYNAEQHSYFLTIFFLRSSKGGKLLRNTYYISRFQYWIELFIAPIHRTMQEFLDKSRVHGWRSFRHSEVGRKKLRYLKNGETVIIDSTHIGHNLPDQSGHRFCINLCSAAGNPTIGK